MVTDRFRANRGSSTTPAVKIWAFSGWRFGFPPILDRSCVRRSPVPLGGTGEPGEVQFAGSGAGPLQGSDTFGKLSAWPRNRSEMEGARKPVEYVPRMVTSRMTRQRPPTL